MHVQEAQGPGKIDRAHVNRRFCQHEQHQRQRHVMAENTNAHYASPIYFMLLLPANITVPCRTTYDRPYSPSGSVLLLCPSSGLTGGVYPRRSTVSPQPIEPRPEKVAPALAQCQSCPSAGIMPTSAC